MAKPVVCVGRFNSPSDAEKWINECIEKGYCIEHVTAQAGETSGSLKRKPSVWIFMRLTKVAEEIQGQRQGV